jgi:hypothetical protein
MGSQSVPNYTPYMFDPNVQGMTPVTQEYPTLRPFPYGSMGVDYNNWLTPLSTQPPQFAEGLPASVVPIAPPTAPRPAPIPQARKRDIHGER